MSERARARREELTMQNCSEEFPDDAAIQFMDDHDAEFQAIANRQVDEFLARRKR